MDLTGNGSLISVAVWDAARKGREAMTPALKVMENFALTQREDFGYKRMARTMLECSLPDSPSIGPPHNQTQAHFRQL